MKLAIISAPFSLSAVLFVLSYLSSPDSESGMFPIMLLVVGILVAVKGIGAIFFKQ
jgi:hypothetical protein